MEKKVESVALNRRGVLGLGGALVTGLFASRSLLGANQNASAIDTPSASNKQLAKQIETIIGAQGMFSDGVFSIEIDRDDINNVTIQGVPITPSFQINGTLYFEFLAGGQAITNSDMALKSSEINPFIDQLLANGLVFQAEHQHFYDFNPLVWFIHFRAVGDALQIAHGIKAALSVTSTPFPQTMPSNPTTPLPSKELGKIIGASPQIGGHGVVSLNVPREDPISLGGLGINPYLNVATSVAFEPYGASGNAAAIVDYGMVASEIDRVVALMRKQGWDIGCLYNQETAESPQLYFSHQFKTGNALDLAMQIRNGLDLMDVKFD